MVTSSKDQCLQSYLKAANFDDKQVAALMSMFDRYNENFKNQNTKISARYLSLIKDIIDVLIDNMEEE